jgi:hypothetical protein
MVVTQPAPLAVTPAPVKLRVVTAVESVTPSSWVVSEPPPDGVANVPSPRRKVVVLFGGVGTAPPTVEVIVGALTIGLLTVPVTVILLPAVIVSA